MALMWLMKKIGTPSSFRLAVLLSSLFALLASSCHSKGISARVAKDAAEAAPGPDASSAQDVPDGDRGRADSPFDRANADSTAPDAAFDAPSGFDSSLGSGGDVQDAEEPSDGAPDALGAFQCSFVGLAEPFFCNQDQFCLSHSGGAVGNQTTYSCEPFPAFCVASRSCDCFCGAGRAGDCTNELVGGHCLCIAGADGLTFLCSAP